MVYVCWIAREDIGYKVVSDAFDNVHITFAVDVEFIRESENAAFLCDGRGVILGQYQCETRTYRIDAHDNALGVVCLLDGPRDTGDSATSTGTSDHYIDLAR